MEFGELLKAFLLDLQSLFRFQVRNPDLTLPQILLLSTISDEGTDMSSLSKQMGVDNSTMTRLIDVLIRNGWAIKYKNQTDGRIVNLISKFVYILVNFLPKYFSFLCYFNHDDSAIFFILIFYCPPITN